MSMSPPTSPAISQASTILGLESPMSLDDGKALSRRSDDRVKGTTTARDILIFLIAFRIANALSVKTFFQPDEFFQSLEPAWEIAFGANSGAWITWVSQMSTKQTRGRLMCVGAGMEEPFKIRYTSCPLRRHVLDGSRSFLDITFISCPPCRPSRSGSKDCPGCVCSARRLLHMEAWRRNVWRWE